MPSSSTRSGFPAVDPAVVVLHLSVGLPVVAVRCGAAGRSGRRRLSPQASLLWGAETTAVPGQCRHGFSRRHRAHDDVHAAGGLRRSAGAELAGQPERRRSISARCHRDQPGGDCRRPLPSRSIRPPGTESSFWPEATFHILWDMPEARKFCRVGSIESGRSRRPQGSYRSLRSAGYAGRLSGKHVLMIAGKVDQVVPPASTQAFWNAAGRPEIHWFDCGHYSAIGYLLPAIRTTVDFLARARPSPR